MITSADKGINTPIQYSYLNKPEELDFGNGEKIDYLYDGVGNKIARIILDGDAIVASSLIYSGNFVYDLKGNLQYIATSEAKYQHYYPFGMELEAICYSSGADLANNHLYNGKELQPDYNLQWYDYGARFYDPQLGRWHSVDPLAENYRRWSPYNYCLNNPLKLTDPDGRGPELALYFVPGVGEALLAATVLVAVSYVVYKAS